MGSTPSGGSAACGGGRQWSTEHGSRQRKSPTAGGGLVDKLVGKVKASAGNLAGRRDLAEEGELQHAKGEQADEAARLEAAGASVHRDAREAVSRIAVRLLAGSIPSQSPDERSRGVFEAPAAVISSAASCIPSRTWSPHGAKLPVGDVRAPMAIGSPSGAGGAEVGAGAVLDAWRGRDGGAGAARNVLASRSDG